MSDDVAGRPSVFNHDDEFSDTRELQNSLFEAQSCNKRLTQELIGLKKQYAEAIELARQARNEHDEKTGLLSRINALTAEKDEVEQRLKILTRVNEELRQKSERFQPQPLPTDDSSAIRSELAKERATNAADMQNACKRVHQAEYDRDSARRRSSELEDVLMSLFKAASCHFGRDFSNVRDLIAIMTAPPPDGSRNVTGGDSGSDIEVERLRKESGRTISKLKKRLRSAEKLRGRLESCEERNGELDAEIAAAQEDVELARRAAIESEKGHEAATAASAAEISRLRTCIDDLSARLSARDAELDELRARRPTPTAAPASTLVHERTKVREAQLEDRNAAVASLKERVVTLSREVNSGDHARGKVEQRAREAEERAKSATEQMLGHANEAERLKLTVDRMRERAETAESEAVVAKGEFGRCRSELADAERSLEGAREVNAGLQQNIERQRQELTELYTERGRAIDVVKRMFSVATAADSVHDKLCEDNKRLKVAIGELQTKLDIATVPPPRKVVETIPPTSWLVTDFPGELRAIILEIAQNEALPLNAKLRNVLTVISRFYNAILRDNESAIQRKNEDFDTSLERVERFLVSLGSVIGYEDLSLEMVLSATMGADAIAAVKRIKEERDRIASEKQVADDNACEICEKLGVRNIEDVIKELGERDEMTERLERALRNQEHVLKKEERAVRKLAAESDEVRQTMDAEIYARDTKLAELALENKHLQAALKEQKSETVAIRAAKQEEAIQNDSRFEQLQQETDCLMERARKDHEAERQELLANIEAKQTKIEIDSSRLQQMAKETARWKKTAEAIRKAKDAKGEELARVVDDLETTNADYAARVIAEKGSVKEQYESLITDLEVKNVQLRQLIGKNGDAVEMSEARNRDLLQRLDSMNKENGDLRARLQTQDEEIGRERQLIDAKCTAIALQTEVNCQGTLESMKLKQDEENTRLYGFIVRHFREFFDARQRLDMASVKGIIERASVELRLLLETDQAVRRLLCIGSTESIEDAVAKLLLSLYKPR